MSEDKKQDIVKKVIYAGSGLKPQFKDGTKVAFHYMCRLCDEERTVIDDSRKMGRPMELVLGKKFKLEVWEALVQTMEIGEVAEFIVDKNLVLVYPLVAQTLRSVGKPSQQPRHCCGVALQSEGTGHADLDTLMKNPQDLEFTMELLEAVAPENYEKESWQMSEKEMLDSVPKLREEGNELYKAKDYAEASRKYADALGRLEQLILREKPGEPEWKELDQMKVPLLLNFSQCKLLEGDYYPVIEHCTTVLTKDPDNVKALFRRGKAHQAVWNWKEARADFQRAAELDASLSAAVRKEMQSIARLEKEKELEDKERLKGKLF